MRNKIMEALSQEQIIGMIAAALIKNFEQVFIFKGDVKRAEIIFEVHSEGYIARNVNILYQIEALRPEAVPAYIDKIVESFRGKIQRAKS